MNKEAFVRGFVKRAAVSLNKIQAAGGGKAPVFHMTQAENVPSLIQSKGTIYTPLEAASRGVLRDFEGGAGTDRFSPPPEMKNIATLQGSRASVPLTNILKGRLLNTGGINEVLAGNVNPSEYLTYPAKVFGKLQAQAQLPNTPNTPMPTRQVQSEAATHLSNWLGEDTGVKNAPTVSVAKKPLLGYGPVGVMGAVTENMEGTPRNMQGWAIPTVKGEMLELPQFQGKLVYDPQRVSRDVAIQLKAQGAIPINAGFFRKLKYLQKINPAEYMAENRFETPEKFTPPPGYQENVARLQQGAVSKIDDLIADARSVGSMPNEAAVAAERNLNKLPGLFSSKMIKPTLAGMATAGASDYLMDRVLPQAPAGDDYLSQVGQSFRDTSRRMGSGALSGATFGGIPGATVGAIGGGIEDIGRKSFEAVPAGGEALYRGIANEIERRRLNEQAASLGLPQL